MIVSQPFWKQKKREVGPGKRRDGGPGPEDLGPVLFCCSSIQVNRLEPELRAQIHEQNPGTEVVYYNKGL